MVRLFSLTLALAAFSSALCATANAQFNALARRVPNDANAIVFIDVAKLMGSTLAKNEGWEGDAQEAFESGLLMIPPHVDRFVAAARIDFHSMEVPSHLYIFETEVDPDIAKLATSLNGTIDNFAGRPAAVLPGDYFAVKFSPQITVIGNPARRQDVAYYVRRVDNGSLKMSPYLEEAKSFAEANAPVIMALDLSDAVPRDLIRARLETVEALQGKDVDLDALADAVSSVRGLTLGVSVSNAMTGSLKVDFAQDVSLLGDAAKPLLLELLASRGMMIDELNDWKVESNGTTIRLIGKLEESGMRRIMSLIPVPPPLQEARVAAASVPEEQAQENLTVAASRNYFKSVDSLIQDLKKSKRSRSTMGQSAAYFERYADRIDRLPSLNVDPYLLDFGAFASGSLRNGSQAVRGALVNSTIAQQNVPQQYDYYTWYNPIGVVAPDYWGGGGGLYGWGGWEAVPDIRATSQLQVKARVQEQVKGNLSANQIMDQIEKAAGDTRREMTQKYGVNF
ncbi:MAG TPA: hypothetical protein VGN57_22490 [Pirellulaceae bacterium]|jgi:hypothetical protein|nr:hypothetical protein [Pirellulaceae bacterium]